MVLFLIIVISHNLYYIIVNMSYISDFYIIIMT